jgi:hypothetical protein
MSRNASKELKVGAAKRAPLAEQARGPHEVGEPTPELTPLRRDPLAGLPAPPPSAASVAGHAARLVRATGGRLSRAGGGGPPPRPGPRWRWSPSWSLMPRNQRHLAQAAVRPGCVRKTKPACLTT